MADEGGAGVKVKSGGEGNVTVISSGHEISVKPGQTVGTVKKLYGEVTAIQPNSRAMVDGDFVSDDYVLKDGERVEYIAEVGSKG